MSKYRYVYKCEKCGKICRHTFSFRYYDNSCPLRWLSTYDVCPRCGAEDSMKEIVAKPKLFGVLGWEEQRKENGNA